MTFPDGCPFFVRGRSVQRRYQVVDFGSHDGDDVSALEVDGGKRMSRAGGDGHVIARLKNLSFGADEDLESTSKDDESLVGQVVAMRWRLVSRVVGQVPSPHHKIAHGHDRSRDQPASYARMMVTSDPRVASLGEGRHDRIGAGVVDDRAMTVEADDAATVILLSESEMPRRVARRRGETEAR